jgi:LacI family transcriptional regulator
MIEIPENLVVISVDNNELICTLTNPSLFSMYLNLEKGGDEAVQLFDKHIERKSIKQKMILVEPIKVVCRLPTDMALIGDKDVDAAVKFIRQQSNTSLRVGDVVSEVNVSRRTLEGRFRKFLNRTIAEEIRRVRVELIAQLLIDTNLSVSKIAAILNYDKGHMARYFTKEKGLSPLAYRKKFLKESDCFPSGEVG